MKQSKWLNQADSRIDRIIAAMNNDGIRRLKVDKIKKFIGRIDEFSQQNCEQCKTLQQKSDRLIEILEDILRGKPINTGEYKDIYKELLTHLKKDHGLIETGQFVNQWLVIGLLIGAGFMFWSIYSISFGLILGIIIGAMLDADAKKKGKII